MEKESCESNLHNQNQLLNQVIIRVSTQDEESYLKILPNVEHSRKGDRIQLSQNFKLTISENITARGCDSSFMAAVTLIAKPIGDICIGILAAWLYDLIKTKQNQISVNSKDIKNTIASEISVKEILTEICNDNKKNGSSTSDQ